MKHDRLDVRSYVDAARTDLHRLVDELADRGKDPSAQLRAVNAVRLVAQAVERGDER